MGGVVALYVLGGVASWAVEWADIPAGQCRIGSRTVRGNPSREFRTDGFRMGRHEVTVREFCEDLSDARTDWGGDHPQIRGKAGEWRPGWREASRPVAGIRRSDAEAYCAWLSVRLKASIRLPDPGEWEYAARGGRSSVRFPWGWGDPAGRAVFGTRGAKPVGCHDPCGFGLYDMAGNVFEWCRGSGGGPAEARGGSWAERDVHVLEVYRPAILEPDYQDADVGFRLLMENDVGNH